MKKCLTILLAIFTVCIMSCSAFAAGTTITVDQVSANPGDIVEVPVTISGNTGVASVTISILYEKDDLELMEIKLDLLSANCMANVETGKIGGASASNVTGDGTLFTMKFKVKATSSKSCNITVNVEEFFNTDDVSLNPIITNGKITVSAPCQHTNTEIRNDKVATCTEKGYTGDTYCTECGAKVASGTELDEDSNNHGTYGTEIRNAVTANCHTEGYTGDSCCEGCGAVITTGNNTGKDADTHDGGTEVRDAVKATCSATGFSGNTYCKGCNAKIADGSETPVDPNAHNFNTPNVTKEPTCTEKGEQKGTCTICNQETTQEVPALGHSWGNWVTVKAATYSEKGLKKRTCTRCNATEQEEIAMLHKVADTTVVEIGGPKDNTSTNEGEENPNTGASVACIAGIAVIAVAAAAVGIKKK